MFLACSHKFAEIHGTKVGAQMRQNLSAILKFVIKSKYSSQWTKGLLEIDHRELVISALRYVLECHVHNAIVLNGRQATGRVDDCATNFDRIERIYENVQLLKGQIHTLLNSL